MQADRNLHQPFVEHIPPLVMGQLMQNDILEIRPGNTGVGQHNARMEKADQQRRGNQRIDTQLHRLLNTCPFRGDGEPV